ncbi:hypothetical protein [Okeania sp. SIO1I7]|uniref:hypothetical protein n=1 Tax=Okeania sp. SIO1I7 TaxID=2607772 RepID=UPI0013F8EAF0|nr:hypothetical protein [Okeania sp. SIO1I7]NET24265.1 hypothetical protein [Okeania sp. SIO1I7]
MNSYKINNDRVLRSQPTRGALPSWEGKSGGKKEEGRRKEEELELKERVFLSRSYPDMILLIYKYSTRHHNQNYTFYPDMILCLSGQKIEK